MKQSLEIEDIKQELVKVKTPIHRKCGFIAQEFSFADVLKYEYF